MSIFVGAFQTAFGQRFQLLGDHDELIVLHNMGQILPILHDVGRRL